MGWHGPVGPCGCCDVVSSSSSSSSSSSVSSSSSPSSSGSSSSSGVNACLCGGLSGGIPYTARILSGFPATWTQTFSGFVLNCNGTNVTVNKLVQNGLDGLNGTWYLKMDYDQECCTVPYFESARFPVTTSIPVELLWYFNDELRCTVSGSRTLTWIANTSVSPICGVDKPSGDIFSISGAIRSSPPHYWPSSNHSCIESGWTWVDSGTETAHLSAIDPFSSPDLPFSIKNIHALL